MDNYCVIGRLKLVPIEGAKTLQLGYYNSLPFAVPKDYTEDKLYLIFLPDGQVSEEYAEKHQLIGYTDPQTGNRVGGFFGKNRKVRSIKLMKGKIISIGYVTTLDTLEYTGYDIDSFQEGDSFNELNGHKIAGKFINEATKRAAKQEQQKKKRKLIGMPEHKDTEQLYKFINTINGGDLIIVSYKLDGTSVRTANAYEERQLKWYHRLIDKIFLLEKFRFVHSSGTRRVILSEVDDTSLREFQEFRMSKKKMLVEEFQPNIKSQEIYRQIFPLDNKDVSIYTLDYVNNLLPGFKDWYLNSKYASSTAYYGSHSIYREVEEKLRGLLNPGEAVYGEIVGYKDEQKPLFVRGGMAFKYGCNPGERKFFVYNMKWTLPNGKSIDLPWNIIKQRCTEMGISHVQEVFAPGLLGSMGTVYENNDVLFEHCKLMAQGLDPLDDSHIKEGVVVRVERRDGTVDFFKYKTPEYYALEDASKNDDSYVDVEEMQSMVLEEVTDAG